MSEENLSAQSPAAPALVVFSHGKESGPWGSKIKALAAVAEAAGAQVLSINYREGEGGQVFDQDAPGEPDRRVAQLLATPLPPHSQLILVGSSMGGYVSTAASAALKPDGLFLLAPAFYLPGYAEQTLTPQARQTLLVHGWGDAVVPAAHSVAFACQHRVALHLLDGDHRLNDALPAIEPLFAQFLAQAMQTRAAAPSAA